jgi:protein-tyrosine-phosphatase
MTLSLDADSGIPARSAPVPLVLFVSRLNTAASIMAEAILRHFAQERFRAASAGASTMLCAVNPDAIECLQTHGIATAGLYSKAWGEFFGVGKSSVRFLITLCDVYAAHAGWPPDTLRTHWDTPDPADVVGSEADIKVALEGAYETLHARIQQFLSLQFDHLNDSALLRELARIGERYK